MKLKHTPKPRLKVALGPSKPVTAYRIFVFIHQYAASANSWSDSS
jgi:hypothetical protein